MKKKTDNSVFTPSTYVVGIGASAGGLEAINSFFENMPENSGLSFVIVQHLSPDHKSMMSDLLTRHTLMKVFEAQDGMTIEPNCVYLLPSKKFMTTKFGKLILHDKQYNHVPNNAIDVFFESLAHDYKSKAIGIVLSGTGFDGTKGLSEIKKQGGIVVVQDPASAAFDGMPNSALSKDLADLVLPPTSMGPEIIELLKESPDLKDYHLSEHRDEFVLREILNLIRKTTGLDFSYYKRPTLLRRISKRLLELHITNLKDYLEYITYHPTEIQVIYQEFLINVTEFFRDKEAFDVVADRVIPQILKDKKPGDTVKVWSVACCSGEEAYSVAILFHEYMTKHNLFDVTIKIFATDIDKAALETASRGLYTKNILNYISGQRIAKYFTPEGDFYRIKPEIRKMIVFSYHNVIKDPPFSRMDFISCRNMLIYINTDCQKEVLKKLHFALNLEGVLFLGPSEYVGVIKHAMEEIDKKWRVYRCVSKIRVGEEPVFSPLSKKMLNAGSEKTKIKNPLNHLSDLFKETLLEEFSFAGILIDKNFEIKQAVGNFKDYIALPDSGLTFNLLKLVSPELSIALSVAVRKAMKDEESSVMRGIKIKDDKKKRYINITVKPYLRQQEYDQQFLFVVLNDGDSKEGAFGSESVAKTAAEYNRITELEKELKESRENLQAVIEELETTNEELQSANEEMVSTNEELQSTNEELQSLNEELHTVSAEHQAKIKELMDLNDDMSNFFNNSDLGQILVDKRLIIRKFSPAVTKMVNLIETDINRSIMDITTRFTDIDFVSDIRHVITENIRLEKEIHLNNSWYLMRISPYLKQDKFSDGVVVTFVDITETKRLSGILEAVFNSSPSTIIVQKAIRNDRQDIIDFECVAANSAAEKDLDVSKDSIIGKRMKISFPEKSIEHFNIYRDVVLSGNPHHYEYYNESKDKWYEVVLVKLEDGLVIIETNISEKKKAADVIAQSFESLKKASGELKTTNQRLEQSNFDLLQFASVASHDLKEPLRKIQTYGNLLMSKVKSKLEESELNNLNKIIYSSDRMQKLIEDVLMYSKLSNLDLPLEKVPLKNVFDHIIDDLEVTIKEKNADIYIGKLPTILGVKGQIHQLFQNLLSNALKFNEDGNIRIEVIEKELSAAQAQSIKILASDYYCISVKDNGIGFEEAYKEKIFGIFQRLNGNNYSGTGIGLAICKKIIENHKGHIIAESTPGKGAEFIVCLPKKYKGSLN